MSTMSIIFACAFSLGYNDLTLSWNPPPEAMLVGIIGIFSYSLLDNLDGKQARKLGLSSPLGQLLDHGLDASVNALCIGLLVVQALNYHDTIMIPTFLIFMQLPCFFAVWEEYHCGVMRLQLGGIGVDEFNFLSMGIMLISYFAGYEIWETTVFSFKLSDLYTLALTSM